MSQILSALTSNNKRDSAADSTTDNGDKMVSREPSVEFNKALNNSNEPSPEVPTSDEDVGFVGEFMLKDEPEEKKRQRPMSFSKKLRQLSVGKLKIKPADAATIGNSANIIIDDDDNDSVSLMSKNNAASASTVGTNNSTSRSARGRSSRRQMREALETGSDKLRNTIRSKSPSVLRRMRRRDSGDSCSTLMQKLQDDDSHAEEADELDNSKREDSTSEQGQGQGQPQQIELTGTNLLSQNDDPVNDDLSDEEDTVYSQFNPSLNISLRAERSMFVNNNTESSSRHQRSIDTNDSSRHNRSVDGINNNYNYNNSGEPLVVVVTNNDYGSSEASFSLDLSMRSDAGSVEQSAAAADQQQQKAPRSPKRDRGSLSRRQNNRTAATNGRKRPPSVKDKASVSPKRNSSVPKNPVTRPPRRGSTTKSTPTRHSSVPKNTLASSSSTSSPTSAEQIMASPVKSSRRSSLNNNNSSDKRQNNKSPKREKSPKPKTSPKRTVKREKSPKRDKKKERRKSTEDL